MNDEPACRGARWMSMFAFAVVFAAVCVAMTACAGNKGGGKSLPQQPSEVVPSRMTISAALPQDTDLNGYPDMIDLTIFVFDDRYPIPLDVPGTFTFKLSGAKEGRLLREWAIPPDKVVAARRRMPAGPGYVFSLSLLDNGGDHIEAQHADLTAEYMPLKGPVVKMRGGSTLRLGKLTQ
ncbi:MAG: hypothetical protein IT432_10680 [Phycisphaerales bacterium]|nr:hypothetical protein [Phycisphaerales bacterium]